MPKFLSLTLLAFGLLAAPAWILVGLWLIFNFQTWAGFFLATTAILLGILPMSLRWPRRPMPPARLLAILLLLSGSLSLIMNPELCGRPRPDFAAGSRRVMAPAPLALRLSNLAFSVIPEAEQVNAAYKLLPFMDRTMSWERARRLSAMTSEIYRAMGRDTALAALPSVMGEIYADWFTGILQDGHYRYYVPPRNGSGLMPVLVFLHGSFGNFKAYLGSLRSFADAHGVVIAAPSYGFGRWSRAPTEEIVAATLKDLAQRAPVDRTRVVLAGLSSGGAGVSASAAAPSAYRGLVFLSPVIDARPATARGSCPVLVLSGSEDTWIPISYVAEGVKALRRKGLDVTFVAIPGEDHFMLFSAKDRVHREIWDWMVSRRIVEKKRAGAR